MQDSPNLLFALNVAGGVCLLLWGSYMVRMAVEAAYSSRIGSFVSGATVSRLRAFASGVFSAAVLQSATAAILLTISLVTSGLLPLTTAVAVILGADVGSAIAVRVLYLDLSFLSPLLLCIGLGLHRLSANWRRQQLGRIFLGLGLILLSIQLLRQSVAPLADSPPDEMVAALNAVPLIALMVSALFTWAAHSSVAVVLIIASMADAGLVGIPLFTFAVVGANIGSGLIALFLANRRHLDSYAAVLANFLMRATLGLLVLLFSGWIEANIGLLGATAGSRVINAHLLFNLVLALVFLPVGGQVARVAKWLITSRSPESPEAGRIAPGAGLAPALISKPEQALSCARREAFRLADNTEALYTDALSMFEATDRSMIDQYTARDREINARNKAIQRYLSEVRRHIRESDDEAMLDQILRFSTTMENIGDVISHGMARLAIKRLDRGVVFSTAGREELYSLHAEVLKVMQLDITNFAANDQLSRTATGKQISAAMELGRDSIARHRRRLSERKSSSIDTSSIHQDTVRDLMQVVSLIENRDLS